MTTTVSSIRRRMFGLERIIFLVRCSICRWGTECWEEHTAVHISRNHTCQETA